MESGKLDRRITIERANTTKNSDNEPVTAWAELAKRWASKKDVSDGEKIRAAEVGATVTTRFQVRWDSVTKTITGADRIVYDGQVYEIEGTKELERREGVEITASRQNDTLVPTP
jgi:SPP1 family predicted phage head-tail adaptor